MNIKVQGGGEGRYANKGSCTGNVSYLQHEDMDRAIEGQKVEPFFSHHYDRITSKEVIYKIDSNKSQLHRNDSKFFVITVSPSQKELMTMGATPELRAEALREYIRDDIMEKYAENFNKNLKGKDIMYYAKIHHNRGAKEGDNMHAHIIVSRKDISNSIKLSPQTNHRDTKKGAVRGGFDRENFISNCEKTFDRRFEHNRSPKQSFEYLNSMKNGSIESMRSQVRKAVVKTKPMNRNKERNKKLKKGFER